MTEQGIASSTRPQPLGWSTVGLIGAFAYVVVIGGSSIGEVDPALRAINVAIAAALLLRYLGRMPKFGDSIDRRLLFAVILFAFAGALSSATRQSLDAVLEAATYAAAFFTARDLLAREAVRTIFVRLLICVSALLTLIAAARWFPLLIEWWLLAGRTVLPPLDLNFSGGPPWGHRYDVALLVAMLYPAWWVGSASSLRRFARIPVGLLVALIVLIVGSRTLWASLGISALIVLAPPLVRGWQRWSPRLRAGVFLGLAFVAVLVLLSGVGSAVAQRGFSGTSLDWRTAMWGPLVGVWAAHPIAGYGPGSFPWILQQTTYFDTNTHAPRHPDSAPFQLVGEAGSLGVLAAIVVLATLLPPILRGRSMAARWALLAFALACIGGNPTEFPFLMAVAIAWAAYAVPRQAASSRVENRLRPARLASYAAMSVLGAAYLATVVAGFTYERALSAVVAGDLSEARSALDLSVNLDPSMALYWRQRGELSYLAKLPASAASDLRRATDLNPSDDLAWRALALASEAVGDAKEADAAFTHALTVQRSDVTNLLLRAQWLAQSDRVAEARELLAEVVQSWPSIVGAPGWRALVPASVTTAQIIDEATRRWELGLNTPELPRDQGLWLAALANRPDLDSRAIGEATTGRTLAQAELALLRCQDAATLLGKATDAEKRTAFYWTLRILAGSLDGHRDEAAAEIVDIMMGVPEFVAGADGVRDPLDDAPGWADTFGYRRRPAQWPLIGLELPSAESGSITWLLHPRDAVRAAGLTGRLPGCS